MQRNYNDDEKVIKEYNADPQWQARLRATLENEARNYYGKAQKLKLKGFDEVLAEKSSLVDDVIKERPELKAQIETYLQENGFKGYVFIDSGSGSLVIGDGKKVARISALMGGEDPDVLQPDTKEYLKPYSERMFVADQPSSLGEDRVKVEILPQLLRVEDLAQKGKLNGKDVEILGAIVEAAICRSNPELVKNPLLYIETGGANLGILPDGTPMLYDRNAILVHDFEDNRPSQPPPAVTINFEWETPEAVEKQNAYFPKGQSATGWTANLGGAATSRGRKK